MSTHEYRRPGAWKAQRFHRKSNPIRLGELVQKLLGSTFSEGSKSAAKGPGARTFAIFDAFGRIGPPLTDHAEPVSFRRGRLGLRVRSSAWLTELAMMEKELVQRLNAQLPKPWVEEVRLSLGNPAPRRRRLPPPKPARLSPVQEEKVESWTRGLTDERVKEAFRRAAVSSLTGGAPVSRPYVGEPGPRVMPLSPWEDDTPEPELTYGWGNREVDRWKLKRKPTDED